MVILFRLKWIEYYQYDVVINSEFNFLILRSYLKCSRIVYKKYSTNESKNFVVFLPFLVMFSKIENLKTPWFLIIFFGFFRGNRFKSIFSLCKLIDFKYHLHN